MHKQEYQFCEICARTDKHRAGCTGDRPLPKPGGEGVPQKGISVTHVHEPGGGAGLNLLESRGDKGFQGLHSLLIHSR